MTPTIVAYGIPDVNIIHANAAKVNTMVAPVWILSTNSSLNAGDAATNVIELHIRKTRTCIFTGVTRMSGANANAAHSVITAGKRNLDSV